MNHTTVYLDYAAATPMDARVYAAMQPFFTERFFNPSSPYAPAVAVRREMEAMRGTIAQTLGAKPTDIIMTAGATESINLAMTAARGGHCVTSAIEHDAVLSAAHQGECTEVTPLPTGSITPDAIRSALTPETQLISIALANNEVGTVQNLRDIAAIVEAERMRRRTDNTARPLWLHTDASQGVGQVDCNVARLGVDMMTVNAGKIYGPKQVACLWRRPGVRLQSIVQGGGQEMGLRSGTENVAGVAGFARALELAETHRKQESSRLRALRDRMQSQLQAAFPSMLVSGHAKKRLPGSLHVVFEELDAERLVFGLEARGVYVATGSACAANKGSRSHVLQALGMTDAQCDGSMRITLGRPTTEADIAYATRTIIEVVQAEYARSAR